MHRLNALEFTEKKIDTTMAQDFIRVCCVCDEWPEPGYIFIQEQLNQVRKFNSSEIDLKSINSKWLILKRDSDKAKLLAKKIEESREMFVQLEYLARGTDERDVREGHVKLISQLLRCNDALWTWKWLFGVAYVLVTKDTPLYILGAVAGCINGPLPVSIVVAHKSMRYICQYFVKLCHEVGFRIPLIYCNEDMETKCLQDFEILWTGTKCTGVISEGSDIDSAIDAFIDSSITAPWRLQQIYVQENIFEDFKAALAVKADLTPSNQEFTLGNKIFLVERLTPQLEPSGYICLPVQAYRTTKELLSLLETQKSHYLSLWAANSALSNEIALHCSALTVWVNDFGVFDGPPRAALSVYNLYYHISRYRADDYYDANIDKLKSWFKLRADERSEIIVKALDSDENYKELRDFASKWKSGDFVHVTDTSISFGVQRQMRVSMIKVWNIEDVRQIIEVLLNGNAVIVKYMTTESFSVTVTAIGVLKNAGIPIHINDTDERAEYQNVSFIMERMKVIRTNYGTIFAN